MYLKLLSLGFITACGSFFSLAFVIFSSICSGVVKIFGVHSLLLPWIYRFLILWFVLSSLFILIYYLTYGTRKRLDFLEFSVSAPTSTKLLIWAIITSFFTSYVLISVFHFKGETSVLSPLFNVDKNFFDISLFISIECLTVTFFFWVLLCLGANLDMKGVVEKQKSRFNFDNKYLSCYRFSSKVSFISGVAMLIIYSILRFVFNKFNISLYLLNAIPYLFDHFMEQSNRYISEGSIVECITFSIAYLVLFCGVIGMLLLIPICFIAGAVFLMSIKVQLKDQKYHIIGFGNENPLGLVMFVIIISVLISSALNIWLKPMVPAMFAELLYNIIYTYFVSATVLLIALKTNKFGYAIVKNALKN